MTFMQLMKQLEKSLGYHQWPVNTRAAQLHEVFESSPVNGELAIRIMRTLYKSNRCQKFSDKVSLEQCNAALVPIRLDVVRGRTTDIDAFQFMENICHAIHDSLSCKSSTRESADDNGTVANVISIKPGNSLG